MSVLIAAGDWIVNDLQFLGLADGGASAKGCLSNVQRGSLEESVLCVVYSLSLKQ